MSSRKLHLVLGIVVAVNLLLASISGSILGVYISTQNLDRIPKVESDQGFAPILSKFEAVHSAVYEISKDDYNRLYASVEDQGGNVVEGYFHPTTAEYLGPIQKEPQWIKWLTTFHRSLLIGTVGRYLMFATTILTILLSLFGALLWFQKYASLEAIKRTWRSEKKFKELHSHGGLVAMPPILLLLLSAIFLSLKSLQIIEFNADTTSTANVAEISEVEEIGAFKQIIFPFFPGEPYEVETELGRYTLMVEPFEVLEFTPNSDTAIWHEQGMSVHTGKGSSAWSFSLVGIALLLIYFTYTGIKISAWRFKGIKLLKSKPRPVRILYASESGKTMAMAYSFQKQLKNEGIKAKVGSINRFGYQEGIEQLFILLATYGDGEAPANGSKWRDTLSTIPQGAELTYSVLGFGSTFYPKYCQFAEDVDRMLKEDLALRQIMPLHKVNQQSMADYKEYVHALFPALGYEIPKRLEWPQS